MTSEVVFLDWFLLAGGLLLYHYWVTHRKKLAPPEAIGAGIERELYRRSEELVTYFQATAHPEDLLRHAAFLRGVEILLPRPEELMRYAQGDNAILACMALEAIGRREDAKDEDAKDIVSILIQSLNAFYNWPRYFALKVIRLRVPSSG